MELILALSVLLIVVVAYVLSGMKARKELAEARRNRSEIYRNCFLRGMAGILARMAKADGTVSIEEEKVATKLFNEMGLNRDDRELCFESFRVSKDSNLPMSYYASLFAPYSTKESRQLIYEILWDITAADGKLDPGEAKSLKEMISWFSLEPSDYERNERRCAGAFRDLSDAARTAGEKIDRILRG